jgi:uncharacterized protein YejL (UPF0352 family)
MKQELIDAIKKEQEETIAICSKEIAAVLEKHKCVFDVSMLITTKGAMPMLKIVPKVE